MSTAREKIFKSICTSLKVDGSEAPRKFSVAARLTTRPQGVIPQRAKAEGAALVAQFVEEAELALASVTKIAALTEVPKAIAEFLRDHNLPAKLRVGADPHWQNMGLANSGLEVLQGVSDGTDLTCASFAKAGIAETGTLALISGADNPTTLNFLPENHIVVVEASNIVPSYEAAFAKLQQNFADGIPPRTINFITGPSRSADIEQTLLLGAHGPLRLHIVLVG